MNNTHKPILRNGIIAVIALVLILPLLYFFVWRPSDADYMAASDRLKEMTATEPEVSNEVKSIKIPLDFNDSWVAELEKRTNQYNNDYASVSTNTIISRDLTVKAAFDQYKNTLSDYGKSASSLADSLKKTRSIVNECTELVEKIDTLNSLNEFNAAAKDCDASLNSGKSATFTALNDQFLKSYISAVTNYMSEYRKIMVAVDSKASSISFEGVIAANEKLAELLNKDISLTLSPNPSTALQKLTDLINTQKSAFFR